MEIEQDQVFPSFFGDQERISSKEFKEIQAMKVFLGQTTIL
jgi:hypothetical protein